MSRRTSEAPPQTAQKRIDGSASLVAVLFCPASGGARRLEGRQNNLTHVEGIPVLKTSSAAFPRDAGFTLLELLLVINIIGILAAMAIPALIRARAGAEETAIIGALRTIVTAQGTFANTCTNGFYAPSIPILGRVPTAKKSTPYIGPPFKTDVTDRYGYRIRFTAGTRVAAAAASCNGLAKGQALSTFFIGADVLVAKGRVTRFFGVNQNGTIYQSTKRISPFYTGKPPAPARPIG